MLFAARIRSLLVPVLCFAVCCVPAMAQLANRIVAPIDEAQVVTLRGNVHPLARGEFDRGVVPAEMRLERLVLQLEPSAAAQGELDALVEAQHDPASPLFHQWLTPAEFGARFGVAPADLAKICAWLRGRGFTVDEVAASNRLVIFSGTAADVADTFHTEIHTYRVDGVDHIANVQDAQIPAALSGVVSGVLSLHDFRRTAEMRAKKALLARTGNAADEANPEYSNGSTHYLFPADWATIYDLNSVYSGEKPGPGPRLRLWGAATSMRRM